MNVTNAACLELLAATANFSGWAVASAVILAVRLNRKQSVLPTLIVGGILLCIGAAAMVGPVSELAGPGPVLERSVVTGYVIRVAFFFILAAFAVSLPAIVVALFFVLLPRAERLKHMLVRPVIPWQRNVLTLCCICIVWSGAVAAVSHRWSSAWASGEGASIEVDIKRGSYGIGGAAGIGSARVFDCDTDPMPPLMQAPDRTIFVRNHLSNRLIVMRSSTDGQTARHAEIAPHDRSSWVDDRDARMYEVKDLDGTCIMKFQAR